MDVTIHTVETAPEAGKPLLKASLDNYGFIPNLHGIMAESPPLLEAYQQLGAVWAKTSLSVLERQLVMLAINHENECHYCMAAHSMLATMEKMPEEVLTALRDGTPVPDAKLEALRAFAVKMVRERGWVSDADLEALIEAGYTRRTAYEVVLAAGYKTLSNYLNHIAETPVDEPFRKFLWKPPAKAAAE